MFQCNMNQREVTNNQFERIDDFLAELRRTIGGQNPCLEGSCQEQQWLFVIDVLKGKMQMQMFAFQKANIAPSIPDLTFYLSRRYYGNVVLEQLYFLAGYGWNLPALFWAIRERAKKSSHFLQEMTGPSVKAVKEDLGPEVVQDAFEDKKSAVSEDDSVKYVTVEEKAKCPVFMTPALRTAIDDFVSHWVGTPCYNQVLDFLRSLSEQFCTKHENPSLYNITKTTTFLLENGHITPQELSYKINQYLREEGWGVYAHAEKYLLEGIESENQPNNEDFALVDSEKQSDGAMEVVSSPEAIQEDQRLETANIEGKQVPENKDDLTETTPNGNESLTSLQNEMIHIYLRRCCALERVRSKVLDHLRSIAQVAFPNLRIPRSVTWILEALLKHGYSFEVVHASVNAELLRNGLPLIDMNDYLLHRSNEEGKTETTEAPMSKPTPIPEPVEWNPLKMHNEAFTEQEFSKEETEKMELAIESDETSQEQQPVVSPTSVLRDIDHELLTASLTLLLEKYSPDSEEYQRIQAMLEKAKQRKLASHTGPGRYIVREYGIWKRAALLPEAQSPEQAIETYKAMPSIHPDESVLLTPEMAGLCPQCCEKLATSASKTIA